jgi:hypothetical protein
MSFLFLLPELRLRIYEAILADVEDPIEEELLNYYCELVLRCKQANDEVEKE